MQTELILGFYALLASTFAGMMGHDGAGWCRRATDFAIVD